MDLAQCTQNGNLSIDSIARALGTHRAEVAWTAGLDWDAAQGRGRGSPRTQQRLRDMIEVIDRVAPRLGSARLAYAWYRSEPLAGFSGQTAMRLVRDGRRDEVISYIEAIEAGVHA